MNRQLLCLRWIILPLLLCHWTCWMVTAQSPTPLALRPANLQSADSTYRLAVATKDTVLLAEAYYLYGKRYAGAGQHLAAKRWYLRSLRIQEKRGDSYEYGRLFLRLADLEADQWHQADALNYARQAKAILTRIKHYKGLSTVYCRMAHLHLADHLAGNRTDSVVVNVDSAAYYMRKAEYWATRFGDPLLKADVYELIGKVLLLKRRQNAIPYLQKADSVHQRESATNVQVRSKAGLLSAYLTLGQPALARRVLDQANQLYNRSSYKEYDTRIQLETVSMAYYQAVSNWKQAYQHQSYLRQLEKNGLITDRNGAITRLSIEYETQKREARLRAQQRELSLRDERERIQQSLLIALVGVLSVMATLLVVLYRLYQQKNRLSSRNAELVREQNHRVKNNLQVVSSLLSLYSDRLTDPVSKMAVEESQLRVETMALLQRQLYDRDRLATIALSEFIPDLVDGVLETYGYGYLQPVYSLDASELSADQALAVSLIVNELTTNACKYAFPNRQDPAFAVRVIRTGNQLDITVSDNGPGLPLDTLTAGKNSSGIYSTFGLQLIQMQIEQLRGTYQFITSNGACFKMTFSVQK